MGLLTDMTVRDQKTKRKINMLKTIIIMLCLVISLFIPQLMDIPYQQGKQFANQTCLMTFNQLREMNVTGNWSSAYGLEKTP
jgi:hypothetical protein